MDLERESVRGETSDVLFDGATEADGDDEAADGLFGGRAEGFRG